MTMTLKSAFRGIVPQFGTTTPLYTVPSSTTSILKNITLSTAANGVPIYTQNTSFLAAAGFTSDVTITAVDQSPADGSIYFVVGGLTIVKIDATGTCTPFVGTGVAAHTDNTGTLAAFQGISDLVIDSTGTNMYVCDLNYIRKVVLSSGVVTTIAGTGTAGQTANATGTSATVVLSSVCIAADDSKLYLLPINPGASSFTAIQSVSTTTPFPVATVVTAAITGGASTRWINRICVNAANTVLYYWDHSNNTPTTTMKSVSTAGGSITSSPIGAITTSHVTGLIARDWTDTAAIYYQSTATTSLEEAIIKGRTAAPVDLGQVVAGGALANITSQTSDGALGSNTYSVGSSGSSSATAGRIVSGRTRNGYLVFLVDASSQTDWTLGIFRMNLQDGFLQRIAGGYNGTSTSGSHVNATVAFTGKACANSNGYAKIWVVPSGQTLSDAYLIGKLVRVVPGEVLSMDLNNTLNTGDTVYMEALGPGITGAISVAELS